jgi:diacylglycerol kinase family enzyme
VNDVLIFANPIAGRGKGVAIARRLEQRFPGSRLFLDPPERISDDQLKTPASAAIVIGGDGTLRGVAQRLLACRSVPPMLVVPLGTANLMARHLGIKWSPKTLVTQVAQVIEKRSILQLDAARARLPCSATCCRFSLR